MKISELPHCPQWLLDAKTANADVVWGDGPQSWIVWNGGAWLGGIWHNGAWLGGIWHNGNWCGGNWRDGDWYGGIWHNGNWLGGTWHDGNWLDGDWYGGNWYGGNWHDGNWRGGVWNDGNWLDGDWRGGTWNGGSSVCRSAYVPRVDSDGRITVGCKAKTADEWIAWLAGDDVFETPRNTEKFRLIRAHILATITYQRESAEVAAYPIKETK